MLKKAIIFVFLAALFLVIQVCAAQPIGTGSVTTKIVYKGTGHVEESVSTPEYSYSFFTTGKNIDLRYLNTASLDDLSTRVDLKMDSGVVGIARSLDIVIPKWRPIPIVRERFYADGDNVSVQYKYNFARREINAKIGFGELDDYYLVPLAQTGHGAYIFGGNISYNTLTVMGPDLSSIHKTSTKANLSTFGVFSYEQFGSTLADIKTSTTVVGNATISSNTGVIPSPYPLEQPWISQSEFVMPSGGSVKLAFDALSYVPAQPLFIIGP